MKSRERVIRAIEHEEPDRVPLDCFFRPEVWKKLREYYGVKNEECVRKKLGIDLRWVNEYPPKGFKPTSWVPSDEFYRVFLMTWHDEWGIRRERGGTGKYWRIVHHPLEDVESIEDYEFPDLDAPGRFENAEKQIKKWAGEYAIVGRWLFGFFEHAWMLRGFRKLIRDLYANDEFVNSLLDRMLEYNIEKSKRFLELGVDIIFITDDLGMQTGMMINPDIWRKYFKPRYDKLVGTIKTAKDLYIFFHSDGNIEPIVPDLIQIGVDILNPVQPECMDPAKLKRLYGDKLTFHGTISVQETLPFGTAEDAEKEVITRIKTVGYNGGLILAPSNVVQWDVPLENVLTIYETAKKYGKYEKYSHMRGE